MARENIEQLVDPGSFKEYWPLIVARQHQRHSIEALRKNTPAMAWSRACARSTATLFDETRSRAAMVHYDYTVLAGTQGHRNHYKQDRIFELAQRFRLPLVLFGEGGGGRPGEDNIGPRVAIDTHTFTTFSQLSGLVPLVAVVNGRTFAGNTALVACSDVIIATEGSTLGMGGPAMIEGGGLGIYTPEEVGPMSVQVPNGVVDILVKDEIEAVETAKKYLSYFQGSIASWEAHDQRRLRHVVPENRLRLYNMRQIIETIADKGSVLEIRESSASGMITAFMRVEGRPMGVIANNPHHLSGAVDSDGADKGARFLQLCDAFDIPVLSLIDCPGIMVGPEVERTALVRHCTRLFNVGANMTAPLFSVVVRKAYGLGAQAMCGAGALVGFFAVAWPTAEFAGMNIEGAVKLGYRKELMAIEDPEARRLEFERRTGARVRRAKAVNAAAGGGIDDVIDPADTRDWIAQSLRRLPPVPSATDEEVSLHRSMVTSGSPRQRQAVHSSGRLAGARSIRSVKQPHRIPDLVVGRARARVGIEVLHRLVGDVAEGPRAGCRAGATASAPRCAYRAHRACRRRPSAACRPSIPSRQTSRACATCCADRASTASESLIFAAWTTEVDSPCRHADSAHAALSRPRSCRKRRRPGNGETRRPRRGSAGRPRCRDRCARDGIVEFVDQARIGAMGQPESMVPVALGQRIDLGLRHCARPAPANTVVAVERIRSGGALSSASSSRKIAWGRVLGSKYSMRWSRSGFFRPVPARFMALFGVVGILMIGGFGASSRGL